MDLKELIIQCPQLGDLLDEIELRIYVLEHNQPETQDVVYEQPEPPRLVFKQQDLLNQIKAGYIHLDKKVNEHIDSSKPKVKKPKGTVPL